MICFCIGFILCRFVCSGGFLFLLCSTTFLGRFIFKAVPLVISPGAPRVLHLLGSFAVPLHYLFVVAGVHCSLRGLQETRLQENGAMSSFSEMSLHLETRRLHIAWRSLT